MSENTQRKPLIETATPTIPRRPPTSGPQPSPATLPEDPSQQDQFRCATTIMPMPGASELGMASAAATIEIRPRSDLTPGTLVAAPTGVPDGGGDPGRFIGQELCGYLIKRKLAEGGMGEVYEGVHSKIGRLAAIKILKPEFCRSEDGIERFYQEARAVNAIKHENIVDIHDFGQDPSGRAFFVMEYLEGEPLSARIRRGALTWAEAFPILEQTLRALKAAHDKGFVHRDLKPENIWLKDVERSETGGGDPDGSAGGAGGGAPRGINGRVQVKLLDFGIAKLVGSESAGEKLAQTGSVIGTPHYMSPEQINGSRDLDRRTDIYALGVILYEMFAGVTPFVGDTLQAILGGHLFREPPRLVDLPADLGVPAPIAEIIDRMLVKDADSRYDSVTDVLADLHDVHRNQRPANAETLDQERPRRGPARPARSAAPPGGTRHRAVLIGGLAAVIAVASVAIWNSQQGSARVPVVETTKTSPRDTSPKPPPRPPVDAPLDYDTVCKDAQRMLRNSLLEAEPAVRVQGSDALGRIRDQPSVPTLTALTENDPDTEARGHAADALGAIGATSTAGLLAKLEASAPAPLGVWYASALARLHDKGIGRRLLRYAQSKDLAVSFMAGLTLADISQPGDRNAIAALQVIAAHEAELSSVAPYAGALILTKLAALHDARARKTLFALLQHKDEGIRLAAATGLAKLGDGEGKKVFQEVLANPASPNRLDAAVAQIPLGEYGGSEVISAALHAKDPETQQRAARALGEIGERKSLPALIALASHKDWTVRIAAAEAIVAIVGLEPQALAQASVDWTRGALRSQDWMMRRAAAGVLADIPAKDAVPLLAQAIADPDANVRLEAAKSAGRMKSAEAAAKVVVAVAAETDPKVKEQQVKALGEIGPVGSAAAHDTLAQISGQPGRIGVIAAGSLIAAGDTAGKAKLDTAVVAPQVELRLAAVEAAATANNPIVVPTLKIGVMDLVFSVRFAAALGLATFHAERAAAVPVLTAALELKDADVIGRAMAALARFGEKLKDTVRTPAAMIDSVDPALRLAAVPILHALPPNEAVPLLRRLVADQAPDVRHAAVDAIEEVVARDKDQAIKLYKPLVSDADPFVRSKASGQLSRLVEPPPRAAPATPAPDPAPAVDALLQVKLAFDAATAAAPDAKRATEAFEARIKELATATAAPARDDTALAHVRELENSLDSALADLDTVAAKVDAAARSVSEAASATPSPDAVKLADEAKALALKAGRAAAVAHGKATDAMKQADDYVKAETGDASIFIATADAAIAASNFLDAKQNLDRAAKLIHRSRASNASLDYSYAQLYDTNAARSHDPETRRKLLQQAKDAYERFAKTGTGPRVQRASDRLTEITEEIKELDPP